jgi:hypothetical protein
MERTKKWPGPTLINLANPRLRSWGWGNPIKSKSKQNYETQFSINSILMNEIEKKINLKVRLKKNYS